jgi:hypothetical protein
MARDLVPAEVIRLLSFHGPAEVSVGRGELRAAGRVAIAPFEDVIYLLLPSGSPLDQALDRSTHVELKARAADGRYFIRLVGRGVAGRLMASHPSRGALEPWMPESFTLHRTRAAQLFPEEIELVREEGQEKARYAGRTQAGIERPQALQIWLRAAYSGMSTLFALSSFVVPWVWLALQGPEYPARPVAAVICVGSALSGLAAVRLGSLAAAWARWREGKAADADVPGLVEGHLAPWDATRAALLTGGLALVGWIVLLGAWDWRAALLSFGSSGAWVVGPALLVHLGQSEGEARS